VSPGLEHPVVEEVHTTGGVRAGQLGVESAFA